MQIKAILQFYLKKIKLNFYTEFKKSFIVFLIGKTFVYRILSRILFIQHKKKKKITQHIKYYFCKVKYLFKFIKHCIILKLFKP